jgi:hypothetical protein
LNINGVVYVRNNLVVFNTSNDCDINQDLSGSYQPYNPSDAYHIIVDSVDSDDSCGFEYSEAAPQVDSYNGSYVPILPGSPLIDTEECNYASEDQLGVIRPQGGDCEPGSIEYIAAAPPPPPPSAPEEAADCDPFAGLDMRVFTLSVNPETLVLPLYLRFQQEVPDIGEDGVIPYWATLGNLESYLCNQQGFPDRLYCMFRLEPGDIGRTLDLAIFKEGCDNPVFTQPGLAIPEIQQSVACSKDLGEKACKEAGGTWEKDSRAGDYYCHCP